MAGLEGCGGGLGGMVFGLVVEFLLDHGFGYFSVFIMVSIFYPIGFLLILLTFPRVQPVFALGEKGLKKRPEPAGISVETEVD